MLTSESCCRLVWGGLSGLVVVITLFCWARVVVSFTWACSCCLACSLRGKLGESELLHSHCLSKAWHTFETFLLLILISVSALLHFSQPLQLSLSSAAHWGSAYIQNHSTDETHTHAHTHAHTHTHTHLSASSLASCCLRCCISVSLSWPVWWAWNSFLRSPVSKTWRFSAFFCSVWSYRDRPGSNSYTYRSVTARSSLLAV